MTEKPISRLITDNIWDQMNLHWKIADDFTGDKWRSHVGWITILYARACEWSDRWDIACAGTELFGLCPVSRDLQMICFMGLHMNVFERPKGDSP
jgi:hypothetical protein